jgi:hypothetical protein
MVVPPRYRSKPSLRSNLEQNALEVPNLVIPSCKRWSVVAGYFSHITRNPTLFSDYLLLNHATFIAVQSIVSVLFCSLNSESSPGRSIILSSLSGSITTFLVTQSHLTGYHYSLRIRASGIIVVSYRGCTLAKSLSFTDEKTRFALTLLLGLTWISVR